LTQQLEEGARTLAFAALGSRRLCSGSPGVDVEMQPLPGLSDEALQEQRAGDRAGKGAARRVVEVSDLGVEPAIVSRPQRHAPQRIVLLLGKARNVGGKGLIIGVKRR